MYVCEEIGKPDELIGSRKKDEDREKSSHGCGVRWRSVEVWGKVSRITPQVRSLLANYAERGITTEAAQVVVL